MLIFDIFEPWLVYYLALLLRWIFYEIPPALFAYVCPTKMAHSLHGLRDSSL